MSLSRDSVKHIPDRRRPDVNECGYAWEGLLPNPHRCHLYDGHLADMIGHRCFCGASERQDPPKEFTERELAWFKKTAPIF